MMSLPAQFRCLTVCMMTAITILALPIPVRAVDRIVLHYPPFKDMAIYFVGVPSRYVEIE